MTWTAAQRRAKNEERIAAGRCISCRKPVLAGEGRRCTKCERIATRARHRWTRSEAGQAWKAEAKDEFTMIATDESVVMPGEMLDLLGEIVIDPFS